MFSVVVQGCLLLAVDVAVYCWLLSLRLLGCDQVVRCWLRIVVC